MHDCLTVFPKLIVTSHTKYLVTLERNNSYCLCMNKWTCLTNRNELRRKWSIVCQHYEQNPFRLSATIVNFSGQILVLCTIHYGVEKCRINRVSKIQVIRLVLLVSNDEYVKANRGIACDSMLPMKRFHTTVFRVWSPYYLQRLTLWSPYYLQRLTFKVIISIIKSEIKYFSIFKR